MPHHTPAPPRSATTRVAVARRAVEARRLVAVAVAITVALAVTALLLPREARAATHRNRITAATTAGYAKAMLGLLNKERHAHGKRSLTMSSKLQLSAHRHNVRMAGANTMSHQLRNEPVFSRRISNTGYKWSSAGENIGWTTDLSKSGQLALEREMYNEKPPNDGHRRNILSTSFRQVGINVYYDSKHHKMWFTQDFAAPLH